MLIATKKKRIGVVDEPFRVVTELLEGGSLKGYLEKHAAIEMSQKMKWIVEIACGMEHLIANGIIHRDLAARNVIERRKSRRKKEKLMYFSLSLIFEYRYCYHEN
jgi:serine/threonine-protein kinase